MVKYPQYEKSCDEDGSGRQTFREMPDGERHQDAPTEPITSEPERRVLITSFSRVPALRDRACWSLKGRPFWVAI